MKGGRPLLLLLYLASTIGARLCFPEENMTKVVETNCPPDWFCYQYRDLLNNTRTMGCTKYPWRIPVAIRKIIFKLTVEDERKYEKHRPQVKAILAPELTVLVNERYEYCATRELACSWIKDTLYDFHYEEVQSYLDWFEGAKYYMHQHSDRIAEIADIERIPIPWYYFNVFFGFFDFLYFL